MRALAFAAAVLTLSACGTTVPLQGTAAQGGTAGGATAGGLSAPGQQAGGQPTAGGSSGSATGSSLTGSASTPTGGTAPRTGPSAGAPVLPGGAPVSSAGTAPGLTRTTIKIGVYTVQGFSDFASSAGFSVATGDQAAQAKAVIGYLNAHGGIAGRQVVPVFHDMNVATVSSNPDAEYQAACAAWTQDTRVYAVVSPVGTVDSALYDCLAKAGVPTVSAGESEDASFFQRFANVFYQPTDMNLRRILNDNVDALFGAGWFGAHPKVGVVQVDNPNESAAVDKGLVPALARHGLKLADRFAAPEGSSGPSAYSSAVLKFKAHGITHVLFTFLGSPLLFMQSANSQDYYPKYGISSRNSPAAVLQGNAPAKAQHGTMGIGWQPMNDVDAQHDPGIISARQQLCLKLMKDAGQDTSVRATALIGLWICDNFFFLRDALTKAPSLALPGLRAGAESLGTFQAASTFRSSFAPGRLHDGAGAYRLFAFKDDCTCYQYVSPLRTAS